MTLRRVLPVLVMAGLIAFAGVVLLRQPELSTARGAVTSVGAQEVCLRENGRDVCLDAEHIDHLSLAGYAVGDCVDVTWAGTLVVAESLTRVTRCQPA